MDQILSWCLSMKTFTLYPKGDLPKMLHAQLRDRGRFLLRSFITQSSVPALNYLPEEPLFLLFFKEQGRPAYLKRILPVCLYNIKYRYFTLNCISYDSKMVVLYKYF